MHIGNTVLKPVGQTAGALAQEWGWSAPPESIIKLAEEALEAKAMRSGELFVQRGVITAARRDALLSTKPADIQTITWFSVQDSACAVLAERLTALKSGLPFYESLGLLTLHDKMRDPAVVRRAEELDVAVLLIEMKRPVLVFSSTINLYKYKAMGRQERLNDPIAKAIGADTVPLLAIGTRDEVSEVLKTVRASDAAYGPNDGTNIWVAASNTTPEGREFSRIIDHANSERVTDVALVPQRKGGGFRVAMRRNGRLVRPKSTNDKIAPELAANMRRLIEKISGANPDNVEIRNPTDGQITYRSNSGDVSLRISYIPTNHPLEHRNLKSISIRLLERVDTVIDLKQKNLHPKVIEELRFAMSLGQGLVLVCGPTNSGKSTTVAGIVGLHIAMYGDSKKRMSAEHPIERFLEGLIQFNVGQVEEFDELLKAFKRHDPDLIWVGEVRDEETAKMIVAAGAAGNMALSTLHANDSIMGFDVLARMVNADYRYQYIESLAAIVGQRLVPELCPDCRKSGKPTEEERRLYEKYIHYRAIEKAPKLPPIVFRANPEGCKKCYEGYVGELPINEVLMFSRRVKDAALAMLEGRLIEGVSPRAVMEKERALSLFDSGYTLLARGETDLRSLLEALPL